MDFKQITGYLIKVFLTSLSVVLMIVLVGGVYVAGFIQGYRSGQENTQEEYSLLLPEILKKFVSKNDGLGLTPTPIPNESGGDGLIKNVSWGGPDLWNAVNKRRTELGVNPLGQRDNLCTIASIRLNELLEFGKLDGHEGFTSLPDRRPDLRYIFESYSNVAEFLLAGADTAEEAVSLWEGTLAHKKILTGGEYVWGCIYAQNSFAVGITAY